VITVNDVDGEWLPDEVAVYAEWLRESSRDPYDLALGMIEGIHKGREPAQWKCDRTAAVFAALRAVRMERSFEARP
jgi:hypothetical protein